MKKIRKSDIKKLKNDLLDYGLISETFPKYISSSGISKFNFTRPPSIDTSSSPSFINLPKEDGGQRQIYIPNPVSYRNLINSMFSNADIFLKIIEKIENNTYSHSKVINYELELFNIPVKEYKSNFVSSQREKMVLSIGKMYSLNYDLEKFYDNIYTHYLPAGLLGFDTAINMYRNNIPQNDEYCYMKKIDESIRKMANNETKGIITGPFTSRIISELFQANIDEEIVATIGNKTLRRYVDDTSIYYNTLDTANKDLEKIKKIFNKYKLSLKMEKTNIKNFPLINFSIIKDIVNFKTYKNKNKSGWYCILQENLFENISKAEENMKEKNQKGLLKYLFKSVQNKKYEYFIDVEQNIKDESFLYLLNYLIKYPQYSKYICNIIYKNINDIPNANCMIYNYLEILIENEEDIAILYLFGIIVKCKFKFPMKLIEKYVKDIENGNEIVLAVFCAYLLEINNGEYDDILMEVHKKLFNMDNKIDFKTNNWLLKYEFYLFDYFSETDIIQDGFFEYFRLWKKNNFKFINFNLLDNDSI